jgi:hypothetical protein
MNKPKKPKLKKHPLRTKVEKVKLQQVPALKTVPKKIGAHHVASKVAHPKHGMKVQKVKYKKGHV